MSETDTAFSGVDVDTVLAGRVRVDEKIARLAAQLEPLEIVIINEMDLDRFTAEMLAEKQPLAVLNAATSTSGRAANLGPEILCGAGITLIDDLGPDVLVLKDGDQIEIRGTQVYRKGELVAQGKLRHLSELQELREQNRDRLLGEVQAFAMQSASFFAVESHLLLDGVGAPNIPLLKERKLALICVPGEDTAKKLKELSNFIKDYNPVLIGVDSGAEAFRSIRRKPEVFVGDADTISDKVLRTHGMQIIRIEGVEGDDSGRERLANYALKSISLRTSLSHEDTAILLADLAGATGIIFVGPDVTLESIFDRRHLSEMNGSFFVRLRAFEKLLSANLMQNLYRPRISSIQLVCMFIFAFLAIFLAAAYTPVGEGVIDWVAYWFETTFGSADAYSSPTSLFDPII